MKSLLHLFLVGTLALTPIIAAAQDKVVYHIDDAATQGLRALRSIRNHLDTEPATQVVVVALGNGIDFMLEGAKDAQGGEFAGPVAALVGRGVRFEVCELTLRARDLKQDAFLQEAEFIPSGVVRVTRLQGQGYAYIKP